MPPSRNRDQSAPAAVSPTGVSKAVDGQDDLRSQSGRYLTTAQGLRLPDTDHSLKASRSTSPSRRRSTAV
jgi:catalase